MSSGDCCHVELGKCSFPVCMPKVSKDLAEENGHHSLGGGKFLFEKAAAGEHCMYDGVFCDFERREPQKGK